MSATNRKRGRPPGRRTEPVSPTPASLSPAAMASKGLSDLKAAAKYLGGVHPNTVRNLIARRELPSVRVGHRVMVPVAALEAYVARAAGA